MSTSLISNEEFVDFEIDVPSQVRELHWGDFARGMKYTLRKRYGLQCRCHSYEDHVSAYKNLGARVDELSNAILVLLVVLMRLTIGIKLIRK